MTGATPLYFGPQNLFGWYHSPAAAQRDVAIVIVPPNGYDMICMHWGWRRLAIRLTSAGFSVLRFDLQGTGDSSGDDCQPDRVGSWLKSVDEAIDFVKEQAKVSKVILIGSRLGGTLAAMSSTREDVIGVVLYVPCVTGRMYVRELKALAAAARASDSDEEVEQPNNDVVMAGWILTEETVNSLGKLDISKLSFVEKHVLYMYHRELSVDQRLVTALQSSILHTVTVAQAFPEFSTEAVLGKEPVSDFDNILHTIESWSVITDSKASTSEYQQQLSASEFVEEPYQYGSGFFGVLCKPVNLSASRCVIFASTAANHHIGTHRMFVYLARQLAARGVASFRVDVAGVGDSETPSGRIANQIYSLDAVDDLIKAVDLARSKGFDEIVLCGICSGAYLAYQTAIADNRVKVLLCINLYRFIWRDTDYYGVGAGPAGASIEEYVRRAFRFSTWKRLFTGSLDLKNLIPMLAKKVSRRLKSLIARIGSKFTGNSEWNPVLTACNRMLQQGSRIRLMFSEGDSGLEELALYLGTDGTAVQDKPGFECIIVPNADHTFTKPEAIDKILEQCLR